ncbi:hypothetical protein MKX01_037411 [Papaver californicum]|nr:hypothetical protein MKX01_037411 [Papaver californicum]
MDSARIFCVLAGFTTSIFFYLPRLKKWLKNDALEHAELRLIRFQERHDHLEKSLVNARTSMNESLEFTNTPRQMQLKLIQSYPGE